MYRRILLPTDGSTRSRDAVQAGVGFARDLGAEVFGFYVVPVPRADFLDSLTHEYPQFADRQRLLFNRVGEEYLAFIRGTAEEAGVRCACRKLPGLNTSTMIMREAKRLSCDLIYMASHGWNGEHARLLGSVTLKVLNTSPVPVLVHRANVLVSGQHGAAAE